MPEVRSLRDLFDDLAATGATSGVDPIQLVADAGHAELDADLLAEAVVNYAASAPLPVAAALSDFTSAWTGGTGEATAVTRGLDLLTGAAAGGDDAAVADPWAMTSDPVSDLDTDITGRLDGLWPLDTTGTATGAATPAPGVGTEPDEDTGPPAPATVDKPFDAEGDAGVDADTDVEDDGASDTARHDGEGVTFAEDTGAGDDFAFGISSPESWSGETAARDSETFDA